MKIEIVSKIVNKFTSEVFEVVAIESVDQHLVYVIVGVKSGKKERFNSSYLYCYNLFDESKKQ